MVTTSDIFLSIVTASIFVVVWNTGKVIAIPFQKIVKKRIMGGQERKDKIKKERVQYAGWIIEIIIAAVIAIIAVQFLNPSWEISLLLAGIFTIPAIVLWLIGDTILGKET